MHQVNLIIKQKQMYLFHIPLKIIEEFGLTTSKDHQQLYLDVQDWEKTATLESEEKGKQLYAKLHDGVMFRLLSPFLYFFIVRWITTLREPKTNYLDD